MNLSPITPIPAARPSGVEDALHHQAAPLDRLWPPRVPTALARPDLATALLLASAAGTLGVGYLGRRLLLDTVYASPVTEGAIVGIMAATAVGVALRWRPARWVARAIGYAVGTNAFWTLASLGMPASTAEWFTAGVLAVEAGLLFQMMDRLGWVEDEIPEAARD